MLIVKLLCNFIPILILLLKSLIHTEQCHLPDIEGKVNKTFRNHLILSRYLTGKWWGEQKKWPWGQFLLLLKAKIRRVKTQVMRQKWAFSTLISIGKVKRIYRKRMEKSGRISEYTERKKCRINKTRIYKKKLQYVYNQLFTRWFSVIKYLLILNLLGVIKGHVIKGH